MNMAILIGRLTRDPDVRYSNNGMAVARFSLAINRGKDKNGDDRGANFPNIVCFGKTAEMVEKYINKGSKICVQGEIQTGKYEKEGRTVYTTEVLASRIEFLDPKQGAAEPSDYQSAGAPPSSVSNPQTNDAPEGFTALTDDDIPF